jgi:hypothetical protein
MKYLYEDKSFLFDNPVIKNWKYYVKQIIYPFACLKYRLVTRIFNPKKNAEKKIQGFCMCDFSR